MGVLPLASCGISLLCELAHAAGAGPGWAVASAYALGSGTVGAFLCQLPEVDGFAGSRAGWMGSLLSLAAVVAMGAGLSRRLSAGWEHVAADAAFSVATVLLVALGGLLGARRADLPAARRRPQLLATASITERNRPSTVSQPYSART